MRALFHPARRTVWSRRAFALVACAAALVAARPAVGQQVGQQVRFPITDPRLVNEMEIHRLTQEQYPPAMRDSLISGGVLLKLRVMPDGMVEPGSVSVEQTPRPHFAQPAAAIAPRMRFTPATIDGRPVAAWIRATMNFQAQPSPPDEGTYALMPLDRDPRLRNAREVARYMEARYPPDLRARGVAGDVLLRFRVGTDGRVEPETIFVDVLTDLAFEEPALAAVRMMRFTPARLGPRTVVGWVTMPLHFGPAAGGR